MFLINYFIDSTDNSKEHTVELASDLEYWISMNFMALGGRLVVTSIRMV